MPNQTSITTRRGFRTCRLSLRGHAYDALVDLYIFNVFIVHYGYELGILFFLYGGLPGFTRYIFSYISYTFAFIGSGLRQEHFCGHFSNHLLIGAQWSKYSFS